LDLASAAGIVPRYRTQDLAVMCLKVGLGGTQTCLHCRNWTFGIPGGDVPLTPLYSELRESLAALLAAQTCLTHRHRC